MLVECLPLELAVCLLDEHSGRNRKGEEEEPKPEPQALTVETGQGGTPRRYSASSRYPAPRTVIR